MAYLIEQAGGKAVDDTRRTMDIYPEGHHQPVGVIIGDREEVERLLRYFQ